MKRLLFAIIPLIGFSHEVPKLTLNATATLSKPADELQLKIGVITLGETAQIALAENGEKMNRVFEELKRIGFENDDFETHQFSINPTYTPTPKDPPPYWRATINGYEVTNTILIHTPKLHLAGDLIDAANSAGANSITDIRFAIHDPRKYWTEALTAAGRNAINDAEALANATNTHLVRILSLSLNHTHIKSTQLNLSAFARASSTPIEPGDVSLEASVSLVYEICN